MRSVIIHAEEYVQRLVAPYKQKGVSSRTTPNPMPELTAGMWRLESWKGLYGREVSQLVAVPLHVLVRREYLVEQNAEGRGDDADRYHDWLQAGMIPPPIEVVEHERGGLYIVDGHRRHWSFLREFGRAGTILAWVSWCMPTGLKTPEGRDIVTGLTYEAAVRQGRIIDL